MTARKTGREFTDGLKREAVVLLRDGGRPLAQAASEPGLEPSALRRWRSLANQAGRAASAVRPGAVAALPAERLGLRRLRKELERAQMRRDMLRRAVGTFPVLPGRGSVSSRVTAECCPCGP